MADIAHTVPASVAYLDGSEFGLARPGIQVTPWPSGRVLTRDWSGHNLVEYDLTPALFNATDDTLEKWEAFWHHINGGASAGYIVDPISGTHRDLMCGGIADEVQATFAIPVLTPTDVSPFISGVPISSGGRTIHTAANMLSDAEAECSDADLYTTSYGTDADASGVACDGLTCIRIAPDGSADPALTFQSAYTAGIIAGNDYTAISSVLTRSSSHSYRVRIFWYESDNSIISTSNGTPVQIVMGVWTRISNVAATAPALAAKARVFVERLSSEDTISFYVDCFALIPGGYTRWHLPSQAPGLVEFNSAPTAGTRITVTATGRRVTRCRFVPGTRWSMRSPGHSSVRSIRAIEWPEF